MKWRDDRVVLGDGVAHHAPERAPSEEFSAVRRARLCCDHFTGHLGVAITSAMLDRGWLERRDRDYRLMAPGEFLCSRHYVR